MAKNLSMHSKHKAHVETDMYFIDPITGIYEFDSANIKNAHKWCFTETYKLVANGYTVYVANTFTQKWEAEPYLESGYVNQIITCTAMFKNIHNVPNEIYKHMQKRWEDSAEWLSHG